MSSEQIEKAFEEIESNIDSDDLDIFQEKLVDQLRDFGSVSDRYVKQIFELFEKYPGAYWGEPGAFVHYLESLDDSIYEAGLIASVERCPVCHTLWMLNRLCNSRHTAEEINKYCGIFKNVSERDGTDSAAAASAKEHLDYQTRRLAQMNNENSPSGQPSDNLNNLLDFLSHIKLKPKE